MSKTMCILVKDDFSTMRKIIKNILKQLEYESIVEVDDGTSTLDNLDKRPVDFIISNWNMPKMRGIDFHAGRARQRKVRASAVHHGHR